MKLKQHQVIFIIAALLAITTACSFGASTANIRNAYMARYISEEPEETTVFTQDEIFYAIVNLSNAPDDTITKAIWYTVDAEGVEPNLYLYEAEIAHGDGTLTFDLDNDYLWPLGTYKVELYLNDELDRTLDFSVSVEPDNS